MTRISRRYARLGANPYTRVARTLAENPDYLPAIAEGDSWFAFPGLLWRRNIIGHLDRTFDARMAFLTMAHNGDTVGEILAGKQRRKLRHALRHRFGFRLLLFSAGGNDIVDAMPDLLHQKCRGVSWRKCIDDEVLRQTLREIRTGYETLLRLRDRHNPECHVFTHAYDFPTVNGEPIRIFGKPIRKPPLSVEFERKGFHNRADQRAIVRFVLSEFHTMLYLLEMNAINPFTVVDTRGTLHPSHWQDEMHPSDRGFGLIAQRIARDINRHFPRTFPAAALRSF